MNRSAPSVVIAPPFAPPASAPPAPAPLLPPVLSSPPPAGESPRSHASEPPAPPDHPQRRLLALGAAALAESELLALLLHSGTGCEASLRVSRRLLQHYGSLSSLSRCSPEELGRIRGIGPTKAIQLLAAFGLAARLRAESVRRERIDSPEKVFDLLGVEMRGLRQESLRVLLLDTRYQLMRVEEISRGTVNESIAHPRDIFAPVFSASAYAFVLVHNHPSGDPAPSEADRQLTIQLQKAARLLQVQLLDHVILGSPDNGRTPWFSFKQTGLL